MDVLYLYTKYINNKGTIRRETMKKQDILWLRNIY